MSSPQSATCMHVYICICDFSLSLFCVFVEGVPEMFQASWGRAQPAHRAQGRRVTVSEALT